MHAPSKLREAPFWNVLFPHGHSLKRGGVKAFQEGLEHFSPSFARLTEGGGRGSKPIWMGNVHIEPTHFQEWLPSVAGFCLVVLEFAAYTCLNLTKTDVTSQPGNSQTKINIRTGQPIEVERTAFIAFIEKEQVTCKFLLAAKKERIRYFFLLHCLFFLFSFYSCE